MVARPSAVHRSDPRHQTPPVSRGERRRDVRAAHRRRSGADSIAEYESSPGKRRCFCRTCGSPLWSKREDTPDILRLRLGVLDGDPGRRPAAHIWVSEKAVWCEITDDLPRSQTNGAELEQ